MSASDIHVLPPISTEIDGFPKTIHHDDSSVSQKTSPTVEGGLDGDRRFRDFAPTNVEEPDDALEGKSKHWSSAETANPQSARTHELLEKILETLSLSTTAGRVDRSTRARFWDMYKAEAEEFHSDFLTKYNSELDISLIFAGLFCGVDSTFLSLMQPSLGPDPNATTQALLMMIVKSLNNGTTFGDIPFELPQFNGPDSTTVWIQCLLYTSLAGSLFAALGAMLGKQWLAHYAHVGEKGTAEHRCIDRQRKFVGLQTWQFHAVLECLPSLLQMSLFLFIIGLAAYLWRQSRTISAVLITAGVFTVAFYTFMIVSSILHEDCPFRTPVSDAIRLLLGRITRGAIALKKVVCRRCNISEWLGSSTNHTRQNVSMGLLPFTAQLPLSMAHGRAYEAQMGNIMDMVTSQPRNQLDRPGQTFALITKKPTILEDPFVTPEQYLDLSASCVSWLLVTSTHPDVITTTARMVLEVSWSSWSIDPFPMMLQLRDTFGLCFVRRAGLYTLARHCHGRALACGQAMLHVYFQRWCIQEPSGIEPGTAEEIGQLLMQSQDFPALWTNDVTSSHPDLLFVIRTLQLLADSSSLFLPAEKRRAVLAPPKSEALLEWFAHVMAQCLASDHTPVRVRLYALDNFHMLFMRPFRPAYRKTYAQCFLASAYGMGYISHSGNLHIPDTRDRPEATLGPMVAQLTRIISMQLQGDVGLDPLQVTFAWELMESLAHLCERGSFREVFRSKNIHRLAILLCRKLLDEQVARGQGISDRQWPWIDMWLRLGILTVAPSLRVQAAYADDVKHFREEGHRHIWQCHYAPADREYLIPSDFDWIVHIMREARTCGSTYTDASTKMYFPRIVAYAMTMLCEAPGITSGTRCQEVFPDVSWALTQGGVFFHAALKLMRAMCGQDREIGVESLRFLTSATSKTSFDLSQALATTIGSYYQSSDDYYSTPESYPLHIAYLDIVQGFAVLHKNNIPDSFSLHIDNCIALASLLRTNSYHWYNSETQMLRSCLGRSTDDRPWRQTLCGPLIDPDDNFANSFIRDLWRRLCQIIGTYLEVQPLPDDTQNEDGFLAALTLACVCWQIYDTHPVPDDTLSSMVSLLRSTLSWTHIEIAAIDKQIEIQRTFRCISQVLQKDEPQLCDETRDIWVWARHSLHDHIDLTIETLQPPLTVDALALDIL